MNYDQINENQNYKSQISICEGGGTFSPLIKTLKEEPTTEDTMMNIVKVCQHCVLWTFIKVILTSN